MKFIKLTLCLMLAMTIVSGNAEDHHCKNKGKNRKDFPGDAPLYAVLWQQTSAEYRALVYQAFNIAKMRLDQESTQSYPKKKAVVVDVDETVIDNSPYQGAALKENFTYPVKMKDWIYLENAKAIPGALDFLKHARSKGYDIFYVTNKKNKYLKQCMANLKKLGFPQVKEDHMYMRVNYNYKEERRKKIQETHSIVLLVGDNLRDFDHAFVGKNTQERFELTDQMQAKFGKKFIVLPNPTYGDWLKALRDGKKIPKEERRYFYMDKLTTF